jgi:hypothetical protein
LTAHEKHGCRGRLRCSERDVQLAGPVPQFSLGKSYSGFSPIGPVIVTEEHRLLKDLALDRDANQAVAHLEAHIERAPQALVAYAQEHGPDTAFTWSEGEAKFAPASTATRWTPAPVRPGDVAGLCGDGHRPTLCVPKTTSTEVKPGMSLLMAASPVRVPLPPSRETFNRR